MKRFLHICFLILGAEPFSYRCAAAAVTNALPPIQTVFVIVMENYNWSDIVGSSSAPYINGTLLPMASYCDQYYNPPTNHPSEPNYLWLVAGSNLGIADDGDPAVNHRNTTNHLDFLLTRAGIPWKAYAEGIDGTSVPLTNNNKFAPKHVPFLYFDDVTGTNNAHYAYGISHIRPYSELTNDLASNTVARYNFLTPDLCDDGHDACAPANDNLLQADTWLAREIPKITNSLAYQNNGAIFITWDEGESGPDTSDGPIGMIVLSKLAKGHGYANTNHYTHSSALRTFQEIFGIHPFLGDAANAADLSDLFLPPNFKLSIQRSATNTLQILASNTVPTEDYILQGSSNFITWTNLATNLSLTNHVIFTNLSTVAGGRQFYRVKQIP